jgi:hypothetical protein
MDLSFLIPSKMRRTLLEYFVTNPDVQIHVNELAREIKSAPQLVYRELINLENWGFLFSSKRGNQRVFRVNQRFVFLKPTIDLIKAQQKLKQLRPKVDKFYDFETYLESIKNIPIPKELIEGLKKPPKRPRAYDETVSLLKLEKKKKKP